MPCPIGWQGLTNGNGGGNVWRGTRGRRCLGVHHAKPTAWRTSSLSGTCNVLQYASSLAAPSSKESSTVYVFWYLGIGLGKEAGRVHTLTFKM